MSSSEPSTFWWSICELNDSLAMAASFPNLDMVAPLVSPNLDPGYRPRQVVEPLVGGQDGAGGVDVAVHLGHEVIDRGEPHLVPQALVELDPERLAVEVAFEIEKEG